MSASAAGTPLAGKLGLKPGHAVPLVEVLPPRPRRGWPGPGAPPVIASDVTEQALRDLLLPTGLVDVKVAALGDDWSGLKFVWRRQLRAALPGR